MRRIVLFSLTLAIAVLCTALGAWQLRRLAARRAANRAVVAARALPPLGPDRRRSGRVASFGPGITPPRRIGGPSPIYPDAAANHGLEGAPVVELWVNESGAVVNAAIVESAGPLLDEALLSAVAEWRFAPALAGGVPVALRMTVQHLFRR